MPLTKRGGRQLGLPRVHAVDVKIRLGETLHISPLFDCHIDDALCDLKALRRMADERRDLPNHRVIWGGDFCNLVMPPDLKRFRPSVQPEGVARRDDWLRASIQYVIEQIELLDLKHELFFCGNHEDATLKFHGIDVTTEVANHFRAKRGGYSGALDYRINSEGSTIQTFRIVYHHGAGGGRLAKGYNWASPFFSQFDSWNLALYGHCHAMRHDKEVRRRVHGGDIQDYETHLVNAGQWVDAYGPDASINYYAEVRGHLPQPRACPLIKVTPRRSRRGPRGHEQNTYRLDVTVEM